VVERVKVGDLRKMQIVQATMRVIAQKGFQNASFAEIEQEAGISRGLLTYHYPTKDDLVLAVFDHLLEAMRDLRSPCPIEHLSGWERFEHVLEFVLLRQQPHVEFDCLHYTFLAQMVHRPDFRKRLADLYANLRDRLLTDLQVEIQRAGLEPPDVAALGAILIGTLHGLVMQINADTDSIDGPQIIRVLKDLVLRYFRSFEQARKPKVV
jgi:AcrR family transcriptional regulator